MARKCTRLQITMAILEKHRQHWDQCMDDDKYLLWVEVALCFFGIFRLGELLIASASSEEAIIMSTLRHSYRLSNERVIK